MEFDEFEFEFDSGACMHEKLSVRAFQVPCPTPFNSVRTIRLAGDVEATIVQQGLFEPPLVNGTPAQALPQIAGFGWFRYDIRLPSDRGEVPASVEVHLLPLGDATRVVVRVGDEVVYSDEDYGRVITVGAIDPVARLPLPGSCPGPDMKDLPMPGAEPKLQPPG